MDAIPAPDETPDAAPPPGGPQRVEIGAGLRGAEVWRAYRTSVAGLFDVGLPEGADPESFTLRSAAWQGVHACLRRSGGSAQILRRGPEQVARGADQIVLYAQVGGHVEHRCGERVERLGPGDVTIYDHARPMESTAGDFENLGLMLDRAVAPLPLLAPQAHGLRLPAGSGLADLLVAGLLALEAQAGRLSMAAFETAALALANVAAEPVRVEIERDEAERAAASAAAGLRTRARAYVDARLADRSLSPQGIGAHLELSRSALYRLFGPFGGVRLFILARRLDRAVQVLLDDPDSHRALGEVAKRHGFPTLAHFSRLFAERFGMPPSRYCALVRAGDTAWLAAQFERTRFPSDLPAAWRDLGARRVAGEGSR